MNENTLSTFFTDSNHFQEYAHFFLRNQHLYDHQTTLSLHPISRVTEYTVEQYQRWFSDPDVLQYLHPNTPFTTDPSRKVSVVEFLEFISQDPYTIYYLIIPSERDTTVGHISMNGINYNERTFKLGTVVGNKSRWNEGIASRATRLVLDNAARYKFSRVDASSDSRNAASVRNLSRHLGPGEIRGNFSYHRRELE